MAGVKYIEYSSEDLLKETNGKDRVNEYLKQELQHPEEQELSEKMLTNTLLGIEGIPYQFNHLVDRRIGTNSDSPNTGIGRKYAEKIFTRLPLLFLTPCQPLFMSNFPKSDRSTVLSFLVSGNDASDLESFLEKSGRFYTPQFAYSEYYDYVNVMLWSIAYFLGIGNQRLYFGSDDKGKRLKSYDWRNDTNSAFKTFISAQENVVFYLDGLSSIQESFTNSTTPSSIASQINQISETANELKFLFGTDGNAIASAISDGTNLLSSFTESLSGLTSKLGGGIVESLASNGVKSILNGGKIMFPEIWQDSQYDRSYSIDIKLRSPDHDTLSIYLNVLKPYCKILAMVLPHAVEGDVNSYESPYLVKAYCKGLFSVDFGMITGMNVTKGAECCWNDDGLPTQIDISIDITDLYKSMSMSGKDPTKVFKIVENTAYLDFLANTSGLNIGQMEMFRKAKLASYLLQSSVKNIPSRMWSRLQQGGSKLAGKLFDLTS